ncbi:MAG: phosphate ABC transporter permease subunit PstC [Planctomycetes bacterium]|nr:phosphate ABC transporter permease subunit PstC [Planctomycetota bacterium]
MLRVCAAVAGAVVLLIVGFLVVESLPALRDVGLGRFFGDPSWHPAAGVRGGRFNLVPMIVGTLLTTAGALAVAAPLGVASALFCRFYAPKFAAGAYRRIVELLAGIPSVVYGFWGLVVLVPLIARLQPPGTSLLAGIAVLSLMILPTTALVADAAIAAVPTEYLRAAAALGLSRRGTIFGVVLPAARAGILTGVLLATARALGETMAVLMVCGNVPQIPHSLFDPVRTLTANIALEMGYAMHTHRAALFVSGLVLMVLVAGLVAAAALLSRRAADA